MFVLFILFLFCFKNNKKHKRIIFVFLRVFFDFLFDPRPHNVILTLLNKTFTHKRCSHKGVLKVDGGSKCGHRQDLKNA